MSVLIKLDKSFRTCITSWSYFLGPGRLLAALEQARQIRFQANTAPTRVEIARQSIESTFLGIFYFTHFVYPACYTQGLLDGKELLSIFKQKICYMKTTKTTRYFYQPPLYRCNTKHGPSIYPFIPLLVPARFRSRDGAGDYKKKSGSRHVTRVCHGGKMPANQWTEGRTIYGFITCLPFYLVILLIYCGSFIHYCLRHFMCYLKFLL